MEMNWEDGFIIDIKVQDGDVVVSANREGLLSLASHFKMLAQGAVGDHFHLDQYNSLEEGSLPLIVEMIE